MEAVPKKWPLWKFCYFGFFFAALAFVVLLVIFVAPYFFRY